MGDDLARRVSMQGQSRSFAVHVLGLQRLPLPEFIDPFTIPLGGGEFVVENLAPSRWARFQSLVAPYIPSAGMRERWGKARWETPGCGNPPVDPAVLALFPQTDALVVRHAGFAYRRFPEDRTASTRGYRTYYRAPDLLDVSRAAYGHSFTQHYLARLEQMVGQEVALSELFPGSGWHVGQQGVTFHGQFSIPDNPAVSLNVDQRTHDPETGQALQRQSTLDQPRIADVALYGAEGSLGTAGGPCMSELIRIAEITYCGVTRGDGAAPLTLT